MSDVYLEYTVMDDMVRVAAIDEATGTEAILIGPVSAGRKALKQAAIQKLEYVLAKQAKAARSDTPRPGYWA
ncbi:DUF6898 family protein [Minwuia thermotolerans]|jgi:hypothetical protein|uniref:DUF6898 family protein n=1 Tax=Minwuia thermotolerans TaxID=2056226 RepID=UPI0007F08937|nr:hypothetical protein [Minwuia thermotolerans]ANK80098.1 MAG: hypothetical protein TEF_04305 [Rhizobiales bacterium NRL2]